MTVKCNLNVEVSKGPAVQHDVFSPVVLHRLLNSLLHLDGVVAGLPCCLKPCSLLEDLQLGLRVESFEDVYQAIYRR